MEQNWKKTFQDFGIQQYADFVSNGSLDKVLDENNYDSLRRMCWRKAFQNDVLVRHYEEENVSAPRANEMGVQVGMAIALLNAISREIEDDNEKQKIAHLVSLVQRGAISAIAKRLQKLSMRKRRR